MIIINLTPKIRKKSVVFRLKKPLNVTVLETIMHSHHDVICAQVYLHYVTFIKVYWGTNKC